MSCKDCERYKLSASMWRNEAYKHAGTPLPWEPEELLRKEYQRGYADAMGWKVQNHLEHLPPNFIDALKYDVAKRDSEAEQAYTDAIVGGTGVMIGDKRVDPASIYKREWIELTNDEVVHLKMLGRDLEFVSMTALRRFARDIAQTLKEKNHDSR